MLGLHIAGMVVIDAVLVCVLGRRLRCENYIIYYVYISLNNCTAIKSNHIVESCASMSYRVRKLTINQQTYTLTHITRTVHQLIQ